MWQTLLDLDALSKAENKNWVWKGASCLQPEERYCLVRLSDGGGDAVEIREFDAEKKEFVAGGFRFERGKQNIDWIDRDTLIAARSWSGDDLTESGYPFVIKTLRRGQALDAICERLLLRTDHPRRAERRCPRAHRRAVRPRHADPRFQQARRRDRGGQ